jgi:hypothetical protein
MWTSFEKFWQSISSLLKQHWISSHYLPQVRRLRVQQRLRTAESKGASSEENEMPEIPSTIPFMHHAVSKQPSINLWEMIKLASKVELSSINSSFCFPKQSPKTMKQLYMMSFSVISGIILFGGLIAPVVSSSFVYNGTPLFL